ncbi:hypothetical protein ACHAW6_011123 [Cyclotella cf. meneghiniana]
MLAAKILFNRVFSKRGAKFMTMDVSIFYLMTPLKCPEYLRVHLVDLPEEIIREYQLCNKVTNNGLIYLEVVKGMYGLPQAGLLANELLEQLLNKNGYYQSKLCRGYGNTRPDPFNSPWYLMILELNTLDKSMPSTSKKC